MGGGRLQDVDCVLHFVQWVVFHQVRGGKKSLKNLWGRNWHGQSSGKVYIPDIETTQSDGDDVQAELQQMMRKVY